MTSAAAKRPAEDEAAVYMLLATPYLRSDAHHGDAVPTREGVNR